MKKTLLFLLAIVLAVMSFPLVLINATTNILLLPLWCIDMLLRNAYGLEQSDRNPIVRHAHYVGMKSTVATLKYTLNKVRYDRHRRGALLVEEKAHECYSNACVLDDTDLFFRRYTRLTTIVDKLKSRAAATCI